MKFKILFVLGMSLFLSNIVFAEKSILYISDNTHISNYFNTKYIDMLQNLIDKDYVQDNVSVNNLSRFDINTTQCLELFDTMYKRGHQDSIILMIGDSNYHNLYGFSKYIKNRDINRTIKIKYPKNVYEINNEMLRAYAKTKKNTLTRIVSVVYNTLMGTGHKNFFEPKVVPNFYVLNNSFVKDNNFKATIEAYRYAWTLIRDKKYDEAKNFLKSVLEKKPSQSLLYYALGSVYLSENSKDCEYKALQCFEDGILVDPLNNENVCYKGLALIYMLYKGEITSEVLYFARELSEYITFQNEDFESIMAINTVDYNEKIKIIDSWILSDIDKLRNKAIMSNTKLIFTSYPEDLPVNSLISEYVKNNSRVLYMDNKYDDKDNSDFVIYRFAKKMYDFLKENKIIN